MLHNTSLVPRFYPACLAWLSSAHDFVYLISSQTPRIHMAAMDAIMELARHNQIKVSLVPRPPPSFVLRFEFSILHGSRRHSEKWGCCICCNPTPRKAPFFAVSSASVYYIQHKPKNKKRGRPWNVARLRLKLASFSCPMHENY